MLELVHEAGTHVMFENQEIVAHNALVNPALRSKVTASKLCTEFYAAAYFRSLLCFT